MVKLSKNMIGVAGEYYVCAELCRLNVLAVLTPKNNPLFDIMASDPGGKKSVAIQVKTMGLDNKQGWRLGVDIENDAEGDLFVIMVNMKENGENEFYIYEYNILAEKIRTRYKEYIETPKKDGSPRKEVNFRWHDFRFFDEDDHRRKNNWDIIINKLK